MPAVVRRVAELFGTAPDCRLNHDEVVALGAAVRAGLVGRAAAVRTANRPRCRACRLGQGGGDRLGRQRGNQSAPPPGGAWPQYAANANQSI
jgi:hypothetical protein